MKVSQLALMLLCGATLFIVETLAQNNIFSNRNWTWIGGSTTGDHVGSFGTRGVEDASTLPPARFWHSSVYHAKTKSIYLFGGKISTVARKLHHNCVTEV